MKTGQCKRNPLKKTLIHSSFLLPLYIKVIGINSSMDGQGRSHSNIDIGIADKVIHVKQYSII